MAKLATLLARNFKYSAGTIDQFGLLTLMYTLPSACFSMAHVARLLFLQMLRSLGRTSREMCLEVGQTCDWPNNLWTGSHLIAQVCGVMEEREREEERKRAVRKKETEREWEKEGEMKGKNERERGD